MGVERRTTAHPVFEDGDRVLISVEVSELTRIFADDYVQYDKSGKASTKQDAIVNLGSGQTCLVSMTSTGRHIRPLREDVATLHRSGQDVPEQSGLRFFVRCVFLDVVVKREGQWRIIASQLAR
jgi:Domain of unknown function (DUF4440)